MRLLFLFPVAALLLTAADRPEPAPPAGIPSSAVPSGTRAYRYVDPQGKAWLYSMTPFGVVRVEERTASPEKSDGKADQIRVTEAGEVLRFERATPFGVSRWERKKSELNETERAAWQRARQSAKQE